MDAEDRQEILDLISAYSYSYDDNEIDALTRLFDDEAVTNIFVPSQDRPFHTTTTLTQLREEIGERRASLARKGIQTRHFVASTTLTDVPHDRGARTHGILGGLAASGEAHAEGDALRNLRRRVLSHLQRLEVRPS
jgi:hypothetical protein